MNNVSKSPFTFFLSGRRVLAVSALAASLALAACGDDSSPDSDHGALDVGPDASADAGPDTGPQGEPAALSLDGETLVSFGSLPIDETSSATTVTVVNDGELASSALEVSLEGAHADEFSIVSDDCDGATLPAEESCTLDVTFTPDGEGDHSATLAVAADEGGSIEAVLEGAGLAPAGLALSPTPHAFGEVIVGETSDTQEFTVTNTGGVESGALTANLSGGEAGEFEIVDDECGGTLDGGASCVITVAFAPESPADMSTTLRVVGGADDGEAEASLSGVGINDAKLEVDDGSHDFNQVVVGNRGTTKTVTVSNSGDVDTGELSTTLSGDDSQFDIVDDCSGAVLADDTCAIEVTYEPQTAAEHTVEIEVEADPGDTTTTTITGEGLAPSDLDIDPSDVDFTDDGSIEAGSRGPITILTVTNNGAPTDALATSFGGDDSAHFEIVGNTDECDGVALPTNGSCDIGVRFTPQTAGEFSATLRVRDPSQVDVIAVASLGGAGEAAPEPAELAFDRPSLRFGDVSVDEQTSDLDIDIVNGGELDSSAPDLAITGADAADFEVIGTPCNTAVEDSCTVTVRFDPAAAGSKSATLELDAADGGFDAVPLTGRGIIEADFRPDKSVVAFNTDVVEESQSTNTRSIVFSNYGTMRTGEVQTGFASGATSPNFTIESDTCTGNRFGQDTTPNCTITVRFTPSEVGHMTDTLIVEAAPGTPDDGIEIALSGTSQPTFGITGDVSDPHALSSTPDADPFEFVETPIGQDDRAIAFSLHNTGGNATGTTERLFIIKDLSGPDADEFSISLGSCTDAEPLTDGQVGPVAPGDDASFCVQFTPEGSPGLRTATITVEDDRGNTKTLDLQAEAGGSVVISPADVDFEATTIGASEGDTFEFTVTNYGDSESSKLSTDLDGENFAIISDACEGATLAAEATCAVTVRFFPEADTSYDAELSVTADDTTDTATISGYGQTAAELEVVPSSDVDFGSLTATTTESLTYEVWNNGQQETANLAAPTLHGNHTDSDGNRLFTIDAQDCEDVSLANGEFCEITVRAAPTASMASTDPAAEDDYTVTLEAQDGSGLGADIELGLDVQPQLVVSPADQYDFGEQTVETTSEVAFTVTHQGGDAVDLSGATSLSGEAFSMDDGCSTTLSSSEPSCEITVTFAPTADNAAPSGVLTIAEGSAANELNVELQGTALGEAEIVFPRPVSSWFQSVRVGESVTRTYTLQNVGESDSGGLSYEFEPALETTDFSIASTGARGCDIDTPANNNLAPGETCTFDITFSPQSEERQEMQVTVEAEGASEPFPVPYPIVGIGTPTEDSGAEVLEILPGNVYLEETAVGEVSASKEFEIYNRSDDETADNIVVETARFDSNDDTDSFCVGEECDPALTDDCTDASLAPDTSCTVEVQFTPTEPNPPFTPDDNVPDSHAGRLVVDADDFSGDDVWIFGDARQAASLTVDVQAPYSFGNVARDVVETQTFAFTNTGWQSTGSISIDLAQVTNDEFTLGSNNCDGADLAAGETCTVEVEFQPGSISADHEAELTVTPTNGEELVLGLTGSGVVADGLAVSPDTASDAVECDDTAVGNAAACGQFFTVSNEGDAASGPLTVELSDASFMIDWETSSCADEDDDGHIDGLGANGSCELYVTFEPAAVANHSGTLTVTAEPGGSASAEFEGAGISALSVAKASTTATDTDDDDALEFAGETETFVFTNAADTAATGPLTVSINGADADHFDVTGYDDAGQSCIGTRLAGGESCNVEVTFFPDAQREFEATLEVSDGDADKTAAVDIEGSN